MAGWISIYTDSPEVILEESTWDGYLAAVAYGDDTPPKWKVHVVQQKKMRTSLTLAAARTAAVAYNAMANTTATVRRGGDADQYVVDVMQTTRTITKVI